MVRLYWQGDVFDSRPIATYTEIFIQIGQLVRKIFTDKLFRTDRHTHTHTHTRQAKNQFSSRFSESQEMCLAQLRILDGYFRIRSTNMEVQCRWPILLLLLLFDNLHLGG